MRWIVSGLVVFWLGLTIVAYAIVLPDRRQNEDVLIAVSEAVALGDLESAHEEFQRLAERWPESIAPLTRQQLSRLEPEARQDYLDLVGAWWATRPLDEPDGDLVRLVWSTDDNPARRTQTHMFRVWHLRTYGRPIDLVTDPSNRDITKTIVQCVAGAGPDIIEAYGPVELSQFVDAGVALDVTDHAMERGFGADRMFESARSSVSKNGRQYAFTCNVGYTVLFYHRDLFQRAGVTPPSAHTAGWSLADMIETAHAMQADASERDQRLVGLMSLGAWPMVYGNGATYFNENATASTLNNPKTIAALQAYQDLIYVDRVMPTLAEAASMASAGGAMMHADTATASASSLFAAKATAMVVDGRWSYSTLATRNRDRVIRPAIERELAHLENQLDEASGARRALLNRALATLVEDVLLPLTDEEYGAMESCLNEDDRERLVHVGIAHVPTLTGTPWYEVAGRVAVVNRASPHADLAIRFLEFLASEAYNEHINGAFDSICGMPEYCRDEDGIGGSPRALPGLEAFDSPVFSDAIELYGEPWEISPFIGRARIGVLTDPILEDLTAGEFDARAAARLIESRLNRQIHANLTRDAELRQEWERRTGKDFDPAVPLLAQLDSAD